MLSSSVVRFAAAFVLFTAARSASAQGSWLPHGTLGAADIAVSPKGVVWLIAREPGSIRLNLVLSETRFFTPRGSPSRVAVDVNGFPWLVNSDGAVWHYARNSAGKEDWEQVALKAIDIAVGATGAVWAIDTDRRIVGLRNGAWESVGGSGVKIAVDPSGNPWVVGPTGEVSRWTGSAWAPLGGSATDISVAPDGSVFILGTRPVRGGFEVLRLNGTTWEPIVGGSGVAISAGTNAVYVAQDPTTNLVLSSANTRLRVAGKDPSSPLMPTLTPGAGNAGTATASTTQGAAPSATISPETTRGSVATGNSGSGAATTGDKDKGGSNPLPSAGSVVGAVGALGGLLSKGASVATSLPVPVPPQGAIAGAVGAAAAGAAAGAVTGAVGSVVSGAVGSVVSGASSAAPASAAAQNPAANTNAPQNKLDAPNQPGVPKPRPSLNVPTPGSLRCPIIGGGETMERGCELLGRAAMKLRNAPSTGCSTVKPPPGYGTPFLDSLNGGECWVCPVPFERSWSAVRSLTKGNLAACFGKAKEMLVWQLGQYPEAGSYRFMPGLLSIALADAKAVDAFLDKRANGDTATKRAMWAEMIADPSGSAELKALLFASLLKVAKDDSSSAAAKDALTEFESYIRARRVYVADEALRMYKKAREVDAFYQQSKDSGGVARMAAEAAGTVATDFKTYAWSAVLPDSAGTAFIAATAALSELGAGTAANGVVDGVISSLNVSYLEPVTKALAEELDKLEDKAARVLKGADAALIGTTLLSGAVKVSRGVMSFFDKDKVASEYEKYVEEMGVPVRVRQMLESPSSEDRQTLLLYWALATSAHKASDKIGTGAMTGAELCNSDGWTAEQCASAKAVIAAAARVAGYAN